MNEEEADNKILFTNENQKGIKFNTGDDIQKNAFAKDLKLSCEHSSDSSFVNIRCYQYHSKKPT